MASALELAGALRALDAETLRARLSLRTVSRPSSIKDAFDLADALLDPASVRDALSRLDRTSLLLLQAAREPGTVAELLGTAHPALRVDSAGAQAAVTRLEDLFLVHVEAEQVDTYAGVGVALDLDSHLGLDDLGQSRPPVVLEVVDDIDRPDLDLRSAERLFAVVVEVADLIRTLQDAPARELAKGGLALPESRRLADAARIDVDVVPVLLASARSAGLVELGAHGWEATAEADIWILMSWSDRWGALVSAWLHALPSEVRTVLDQRADTSWGEPLATFSEWFYPAGRAWVTERLGAFQRSAELFGLTTGSRPTSVAVALVREGVDAATTLVATLMPEPIDSVYLQHDLTAVAPGPLEPALDGRLRSIADVESSGLAATYRMNETRISHALSSGETEEGLREFLSSISSTGLPQPLDYLLTQTAARHGRYRVSTLEQGRLSDAARALGAVAQVRTDEPALLDTVAVDQALTSLALRRVDGVTMVSRFDADTLYWALSDERYPVVLEGADRAPLRTPVRRRPQRVATSPASDPISDLVGRVADSSSGSADDTDRAWIARQLDAAAKARMTVLVTVALPDGSTSQLQMEPTGVGGGRVRGRDRKSDIERTLPLSSIVEVSTPPA